MARANAQMRENALHHLPVGLVQDIQLRVLAVADQLGKPPGDLPQGQDEIGEAGRDRAARHRPIFGLVRVLNQNDASGFLDRFDADRSVRTRSRKDNREVVASLRRERAKKKIDRRALPTRLVELGNREVLIGDQKLPVGRDDVDMARLERDAPGHLSHRHARPGRKDVRQFALVLGVKVNDDDERGLDIVGQTLEKRLQRMDSPRGRSDAHGRETLRAAFF